MLISDMAVLEGKMDSFQGHLDGKGAVSGFQTSCLCSSSLDADDNAWCITLCRNCSLLPAEHHTDIRGICVQARMAHAMVMPSWQCQIASRC